MLFRSGPKGKGQFKEIGWDEALDRVADAFKAAAAKHGPETVWPYYYAGTMGLVQRDGIHRLRHVMKYSGQDSTICIALTDAGWLAGHGVKRGLDPREMQDSDLIVMWGGNPVATQVNVMTHVSTARKERGAKLVHIDVYRNGTAEAADIFIMVRPGTDGALAAAVGHVLLKEGFADRAYLAKYTDFSPEVEAHYATRTPEWAEKICGVPAADIVKLARMYAGTKPAALKASWAPGRNAYGEQYNRMAAALQAITGNIGVLGGCAEGVGKAWHAEGVAYPYDQYSNVWYASIKSDRWAHLVLNYPNVKREEVGLWPRADGTDGQIPNVKAIFWQGSDWFNQLTNINKEIQAIDKLELVVCMDSTITPSGLWADVLFPIATHFERHDVALPWYKGHYYIHRPKVIEPLWESKTDFQVFTELAYRLGFGPAFNPKATRDYFFDDTAVDEAYLRD